MSYPSTIATLANPAPTDRLNSPSHSTLHDNENAGIVEVQTFVGTLSSLQGTISYDVRSPLSNGGGHIQTANKGGTGQTAYTKGDILVASSTSVLAKLAVGQDTFIPQANSSVAAGIEWVANPKPKVFVNASIITAVASAETSVFSVVIPGSTLGTNNAIRATSYINNYAPNQGASVIARAFYGGNQVASVIVVPATQFTPSVRGTIEYTLIANANTDLQRAILRMNLGAISNTTNSIFGVALYTHGTASVQSSASQILGLTIQNGNSSSEDIGATIVEKIV